MGSRHAGLPSYERLVRRLTRPRVLTLDEADRPVPVPPTLAGQADGVLTGAIEDLADGDPTDLLACLERARRLGVARTHIRRHGFEHPFLCSAVDLRADLGVVAVLVSEDVAPDDVARYRPPDAAASHASASLRLNAQGRFLEAHGELPGVIDGSHGNVPMRRLASLIHPEDVDGAGSVFVSALTRPQVGHRARLRLRSFDGGWRWVDAHLQVDPGSPADRPEVLATLYDVDADVRAAESSAEHLQRFRTFTAAIPIGVFGTDDVGRLRYANEAFRDMTGLAPDDDDWMALVHHEDLGPLADAVQRFGFGGEVLDLEVRTVPTAERGERTLRILARSIRADDGKLLDVVGSLEDVTERTEMHRRLSFAAAHDPLTGLANRARLEETLRTRLAEAPTAGEPLAVVFIDLDGFKRINDSLGHTAGDLLLMELAGRLRAHAGPGDLVARFGGDEFVVVADKQGGADAALATARRLMGALTRPAEIRGTVLRPRASIGVALSWRAETDAETLLRDADAAMYEAKARGPNAVWLADAAVRARAERRFGLEAALGPALSRDELHLAYQPVVDLASGQVRGVEALLRWDSPAFGPTPPTELIPVAEETGHIHDITDWVTRRAARDLPTLRSAHGQSGLKVGVNLSSSQLSAPDLVERLLGAISHEGLRPADLVVELTESLPLADDALATLAIQALHDAGLDLAIDDFGAGYASFDYLVRLPVDHLKVDRRITRQLATNRRARRVLRGIVAMCDDMGVNVIAEGIESDADRTCCLDLGVGTGQGYHLGRPRPLLHEPGRAIGSRELSRR